MSNNDILRILRYTFDFKDEEMISIFQQGGEAVDRATVSDWLKKEEDPEFKALFDKPLAAFLNGLITQKRGKKDGEEPVPEKSLNNNQILRKLKIALNYKDEDMLDVFGFRQFRISKHELSAFFRNPKQHQYRDCGDQVLRNFLMGLQLKLRPTD
ncbi:Uncharacterized conserved protein YehS, DUF1456 family [Algoriphagus faecimaris]|uniref:Uncharacterized conserved protein YehS, DUF1456 family n=1 Tax=Algoriphagus faecimaris TaxID=686796 RepID=A0A1G6XIC8_9BACT|nr:DUF1456 family protein [Algoriphagus faecimaris]SDD77994.1 Uncharacterized conserved protein YehS, DUF1456 family [Algoriphagus faecimaris]